jgi:hypothetical protein
VSERIAEITGKIAENAGTKAEIPGIKFVNV